MTEPTYDSSDRRPIQSRNTRWAEMGTNGLVKLGISPNGISIVGMFAALIAGVLFYYTSTTTGLPHRMLWFCGGLLCQVRLLCNLFDGMVAIKRNIASPVGELFNEVPDRVSDAAILIGLGYSAGGGIALGFSAALVSVFVAYVRAMAKSTGAPNDFCGPMAKPQRMAVATMVALFMALAPVSWANSWSVAKVALMVVIIGGLVTAVRRLMRAGKHLKGVSS